MKTYKNGKRFEALKPYNMMKNNPYDYEYNGLIRHLISKVVYETKNPITKFMIDTFEKDIVFLLKYVDVLMNFTNIYVKNR
jgi:hypothetical protein